MADINNGSRFDVAVVGGGVIGAMTALELAERGASVVVLERGAELAWGCSSGNAGIVGASHVQPLATPAAVRDGIRWMLRPDSPFFVRPRLGVIPWLTRFVASATPAQVQRSTDTLQAMATRSAALHAELDRSGLDPAIGRAGCWTSSAAGRPSGRPARAAMAKHSHPPKSPRWPRSSATASSAASSTCSSPSNVWARASVASRHRGLRPRSG